MRECSQHGERVAEGTRNQMTCSNPKVLKGLKAGVLIFRGIRGK